MAAGWKDECVRDASAGRCCLGSERGRLRMRSKSHKSGSPFPAFKTRLVGGFSVSYPCPPQFSFYGGANRKTGAGTGMAWDRVHIADFESRSLAACKFALSGSVFFSEFDFVDSAVDSDSAGGVDDDRWVLPGSARSR